MPKIVNIGTPTSPTIYTKKYGNFRGVDFSQSETMVDDSRSPCAVNVISDTGGFPEKRLGWRTIKTLDGRINGIYHYKGIVTQKAETDGEEDTETLVDCFIIHAGTKIYSWSGSEEEEPMELLSGINNARSTGRCFKEKVFILTGAELLEFDGKTCVRVEDGDASYVPTTWQSRGTAFWADENIGAWNGSAGVGSAYQEVNIASQKRKNTFRIEADWNYERYLFLDGIVKAGTRMKMTYIPTGQVIFDIIAPESEDTVTYEVENSLFDIIVTPGTGATAKVKISRGLGSGEARKTSEYFGLKPGGVIGGIMKPSKTEGFVKPADGEDNYCVGWRKRGCDFKVYGHGHF